MLRYSKPLLIGHLFCCHYSVVHYLIDSEGRAESKPRARDLGIPFEGQPGPLNAITDVKDIEVGHTTLIFGEAPLAVRTGVTAVLPRGKDTDEGVPAAWFSLNGNGEMTGTTWIEESGVLEGPAMITNTHSVGVVRDAVVEWGIKKFPGSDNFSLPVVAETYDGFLNDINKFHIHKEHAFQALDSAKSGPVAEGNIGGGTGMVAYSFKGGIGTSSRALTGSLGDYIVGVLVQANHGLREQTSGCWGACRKRNQ
jgi:D-aminopeptidase